MAMVQTEEGALQQSQPPGGKRLRIALAMVVYVLCGEQAFTKVHVMLVYQGAHGGGGC